MWDSHGTARGRRRNPPSPPPFLPEAKVLELRELLQLLLFLMVWGKTSSEQTTIIRCECLVFEEPQFSRQSVHVILFFCFVQPQLGRTQQCQNREGVGGVGGRERRVFQNPFCSSSFLCWQHKKTDLYMGLDG